MLFSLFIVSFCSCTKESTSSIDLPVLATANIESITSVSSVAGGTITSVGGSSIITLGVCWSEKQNPTVNDNKTTDGMGIGSYSSSINGLKGNTKYYIRAYATNSEGTSYGDEKSFVTNQSSLVGSWGSYSANTTVIITFFDDSHFGFLQANANTAKGINGIEIGTYTWDSINNAFTSSIKIGDDEDWGFRVSPKSIYANSDTLYVGYSDGIRKITKITSLSNPLLGSWGGCTSDLTRAIYVTFIDDTHWYFVQAGINSELSGIQFGTYSWNSNTNTFNKQMTYSAEADWSGFDIDIDKVIVSKDTIFNYLAMSLNKVALCKESFYAP